MEKLQEIINFIKENCEYYSDKELEDDFDFGCPEDNEAFNNSVILAMAREGLGEKVKWKEYQEKYFKN